MTFKEEMFAFIDEMQKSGKTNMFFAPQELRNNFGISKSESYRVFSEWTESFNNKRA